MEHLELCRPEMASLNINTSNQIEGTDEFVYLNTTRTLRGMAERYQAAGIKPELEVFSGGDIEFGKDLIVRGLISGRPLFQFVLGVKWQEPASTLGIYHLRQLLPQDSVWGALGIGREEFPVLAQSTLLGGNVRVGLEDNLYPRRGDDMPVVIGRGTNIQDGAIIHGTEDVAGTTIGDKVVIGHGAILHGCDIASGAMIGIGAIVLDGAKVGAGAIVAAGAIVPPGKEVPAGALWVAGGVRREVNDREREFLGYAPDHYSKRCAQYLRHGI
jgi:carbonic anhydrase/acetyltransferase-like protein (isoleucine patch superfamily)